MLNVNREVTDSFYRYKMPRLMAKVEGKGNGIKTVIVNAVDIAKALNRPPMYATKYFGIELGAQVNHEARTDRYIVNGAHEATKLQELLDGFIKRFVLCADCTLPETDLLIRRGHIVAKCKACGHASEIDSTHKLCTFIQREQPPRATKKTSKDKEKDKDKDKEKDKDKDKEKDKDKDKEKDKDKDKEKDKDKDKAKENEAQDKASPTTPSADSDNWAGDEASLRAAQRARLAQLGRAVRVLALDDDADKTEQERADTFHAFLSELLAQRVAHSSSAEASASPFSEKDEATVTSEAERLELREKALLILIEVLFAAPDARCDVLTLAKRYTSLLRRMTKDNSKAQSYLLGAFEMLFSQPEHSSELRRLPHVLMHLYNEDVLEEDNILEWNKRPRKFVSREQAALIRLSAAPFIDWLQKAEEEDDEEDEDENDSAQQSSGPLAGFSLSATSTTPTPGSNTSQPEPEPEPEEEINVDDI